MRPNTPLPTGLGSSTGGSTSKNAYWNITSARDNDLYHRSGDDEHVHYINTTGLYGRTLDAQWTGGTNITCGMQAESHPIQNNTWGTLPMNTTSKGWRAVK